MVFTIEEEHSYALPPEFLSSRVPSNTVSYGGPIDVSSGSSSTLSAPLQFVPINVANQQLKRKGVVEDEDMKKLCTGPASFNSNHNDETSVVNSENLPSVITDWKKSYIQRYIVPCLKIVERKISFPNIGGNNQTELFKELWDTLEKITFGSVNEVFSYLYHYVWVSMEFQDSAKEAGKVQKLMTLELQQVANLFGLCCSLPKSEFMSECSKCKKMCHHFCTGYNAELGIPVNPICFKCNATMPPSTDVNNRKARDLPIYRSTEYMEKKTRELMVEYRRNYLFRNAYSNSIGYTEEQVPNIFIRLVSSQKKNFIFQNFQMRGSVHPQLVTFAAHYYEKTYWVFLEHDGQEMVLFGMIAQEYLSDNHSFMQNLAYVSFLEGVKHVESTNGYNVFRSVVSSYFSWCKYQGFHKGHIWSSIGLWSAVNPPDCNFLFPGGPSDGMTQNQSDAWHQKLLVEMFAIGSVHKLTPIRECRSNEDFPHCDGGIFTKNKYNSIEEFNTLLRKNFKSVFFFELNPKEKELNYVNEGRTMSFFQSRKVFFKKCQERGWSFGTLHQTVHATKAIVECIHEEIRNQTD